MLLFILIFLCFITESLVHEVKLEYLEPSEQRPVALTHVPYIEHQTVIYNVTYGDTVQISVRTLNIQINKYSQPLSHQFSPIHTGTGNSTTNILLNITMYYFPSTYRCTTYYTVLQISIYYRHYTTYYSSL